MSILGNIKHAFHKLGDGLGHIAKGIAKDIAGLGHVVGGVLTMNPHEIAKGAKGMKEGLKESVKGLGEAAAGTMEVGINVSPMGMAVNKLTNNGMNKFVDGVTGFATSMVTDTLDAPEKIVHGIKNGNLMEVGMGALSLATVIPGLGAVGMAAKAGTKLAAEGVAVGAKAGAKAGAEAGAKAGAKALPMAEATVVQGARVTDSGAMATARLADDGVSPMATIVTHDAMPAASMAEHAALPVATRVDESSMQVATRVDTPASARSSILDHTNATLNPKIVADSKNFTNVSGKVEESAIQGGSRSTAKADGAVEANGAAKDGKIGQSKNEDDLNVKSQPDGTDYSSLVTMGAMGAMGVMVGAPLLMGTPDFSKAIAGVSESYDSIGVGSMTTETPTTTVPYGEEETVSTGAGDGTGAWEAMLGGDFSTGSLGKV
jgi:hypothetical protein